MGKTKQQSPTTVCDQLKAAIAESGLSHYRIAKDAGIRPEMIARYVKGERDIRSETFAKIAMVLGLELTAKKEQQDG